MFSFHLLFMLLTFLGLMCSGVVCAERGTFVGLFHRLPHLTSITWCPHTSTRVSPSRLFHSPSGHDLLVMHGMWNRLISPKICTQFCCALFCCGYISSWFMLFIYFFQLTIFLWGVICSALRRCTVTNLILLIFICPYSSGLLHWHWGNHIAPVPVK